MNVGYFGIILPDRRWWQGYFLDARFEPAARRYLDAMRQDPRIAAEIGEVPHPIPAGAPCPPIPGFIASLSAGLCRVAEQDRCDAVQFGMMAHAFALLTGLRYFALISEREDKGGATTQLEAFPNARSIEDGRGAFNRHPLVIEYKRQRTEEAIADFNGRLHTTPGHA